MASTLEELQTELQELSHSEEAILAVQKYSSGLAGTQGRLNVWNASNALVRSVLERSEAIERGFNTQEDDFVVLQGDIVRTEAAFFYGNRITGVPKFAVLNSSCDLVPGRSPHASLLRVMPIRRGDERAKDTLGNLLKFSRRDGMYLPPFPDDGEDVYGNVLDFQGICQIESVNLQLAARVASLSLLGWRIFGSFARAVVARANPREVSLREAMQAYPAKVAENEHPTPEQTISKPDVH